MTNRARTRFRRLLDCPSLRGVSLVPLLGAVLALSTAACNSPEEAQPPVNAGGTGGTGSTMTSDVGRMLDGPETCTTEHTICATLQVPSDMSPSPALLRFDIYDAPEPPTHPPNGHAGVFPLPELVPGEEAHFELTDAGMTGAYFMWAVIYMPREGQFGIPAIGDYIQESEVKELPLDGSPLNLDGAIALRRYSAEAR